jgi:ribosomal-protein-alanine N-acetyltransferase
MSYIDIIYRGKRVRKDGPLNIESERFDIIAYDRQLLRLAIIDPAAAAGEIGAVFSPLSVEELAQRRNLYALKLRMIDRDPEAWLFTTAWQVVSRESGLILGELGFKGIHPKGKVEIGYFTHAEHRCRGVMTEAVGALCRFAFDQKQYPISVITASTKEGNVASERVLEKNGFIRCGVRLFLNYWEKKPERFRQET